jgi:hypothetical protein
MRATASRDAQRIRSLLDNPDRTPISDRIGAEVDKLAAAIKTTMEQRRIAQRAAERVGKEPEFRTSTEYPEFWAKQVNSLDGLAANSNDMTNAVARNTAILPVLSDIVLNFPILDPANAAHMKKLSGLTKDSFEVAKDAAGKERKGLFKLKAPDALLTAAAPAPAPAPAMPTATTTGSH